MNFYNKKSKSKRGISKRLTNQMLSRMRLSFLLILDKYQKVLCKHLIRLLSKNKDESFKMSTFLFKYEMHQHGKETHARQTISLGFEGLALPHDLF